MTTPPAQIITDTPPPLLIAAIATVGLLVALNIVLVLTPKSLKDRLFVGFGVDIVIGLFTLGPVALAIALPVVRQGGWVAWLLTPGAVSLGYMFAWCVLDELLRGKRGAFMIRKRWIRSDGWLRYALGWSILLAVPVFWTVRIAEIIVYPALNIAWGLPRLRTRDYIALSRHKTQGLVGADYIFCLYCEWMTGLWSLGTEMLRNLESMWCPLRFGRADQCDRCTAVFPDIEYWGDPAEGMAGVERFFDLYYEGKPMGERTHLGGRDAQEQPPKPADPEPEQKE